MAISEGSLIKSLQSNHRSRSPPSLITKTVGDTLSTATICPEHVTASPATISMYLNKIHKLLFLL